MKRCPLCRAEMTKESGTVSEPTLHAHRRTVQVKRVARPAVFYACPRCEHCEEVGRP
jgi:hypothetical protein